LKADKTWIVKAFHTGGPYARDADKLRASAEKFDVPIDIEVIKSRGSWNLNTHYKPRSILAALKKHDADYIIHVDIDTWFMQYPELFDRLDCDFGAFYWSTGGTWCSGTVIARNCEPVKEFIRKWDKELSRNPKRHGDQVAMGILLERVKGLNILRIPAGYIQGLAPNLKPGEGVIAHDGARKRYVGTDIYSDPK